MSGAGRFRRMLEWAVFVLGVRGVRAGVVGEAFGFAVLVAAVALFLAWIFGGAA